MEAGFWRRKAIDLLYDTTAGNDRTNGEKQMYMGSDFRSIHETNVELKGTRVRCGRWSAAYFANTQLLLDG